MKLTADRPFEDFSKSLYSILESIAEDYLEEKNIDLVELSDKNRIVSVDDKFGPLTPLNAIEKTFRGALIHVDLAEKAKKEGAIEVAWARLAFASQLIGRIQRAEEIETAATKQRELTYDLKIKLVELVSYLRPEGGWATHEAAYEAIEAELLEYRESIIDDKKRKEEEGKEIDLIQQMQRWRKGDPLVRAAFDGNSAKTKAERAMKASK